MQELPFQTLTQFAALGLTLIAGWFLGLASRSGGAKWRARYHEEELSHARYRDLAENDLRDAGRRIRELEAENATLRAGAPIVETVPDREPEGHSTGTVVGAAATGAVAGAAVTHVAENHDDPRPADHAEPVHSEPVHHETPAADSPTGPAEHRP